MTILRVRLYRRGKWREEEDGHESVTDVYEVISDSESETITNVVTASGIPSRRDAHPEKASAICNARDADHDSELLNVWYVNCHYSTKWETKEDDPPLAQNVKGGMRSAFIEEPAFYDAFGYPLVNAAGDLYEGLTRRRRQREVNVTANFNAIPDFLFQLADTLNAGPVTIHGRQYPALTCLLTDVEIPDEPESGASDDQTENIEYWPVSYKILIDPSGHHILLPNKGQMELVYQTRTGSSADWEDDTYANYDQKTPTSDRQIIKRRILTDEQAEVAQDIWLDSKGQAQRIVSLTSAQLGTGTMAAGSTTLTLASGTFDYSAGPPVESTQEGALVMIPGAGRFGRPLKTRIATVSSATVATLEDKCQTAVTAHAVYVAGAIVNRFILPDVADWSDVPLPNNHPVI